ncbi:MAG: sialidase family protein [Planctomycetota bacterium]|nr:sialidase family protein [Planctomycetota bacterium]
MNMPRREFLQLGLRSAALAPLALSASCIGPGRAVPGIGSISQQVLWNGRQGKSTWFHPRPCLVPDGVLMTMQWISGSDFYGQVHWTRSEDLGHAWSDPQPIGGMGWRDVGGDYSEGTCDVVPDYHHDSGTVLALGHNVYYHKGRLARPQRQRYPVYVTGDGHGAWSPRRILRWQHPEARRIFTCGCAQRLIRGDGSVLLPISFGSDARLDRAVTSVLCSFDGEELRVREVGNTLRLAVRRGLLEPSLVHFGDRYRMTIRAEDGRGYHATSSDGLQWSEIQAWRFDDGELLTMSTTQQHWLRHQRGLFLVYTRQDATNAKVMRFRAPLYIAQVDPHSMSIIRSSERVAIPLRGDPAAAPKDVARMGNFHTLRVTEEESWVTVGEARPTAGWRGDVLLARIR